MADSKNNLTKLLKKSGLRYTPQRQAILDELNYTRDHRDVEEIYFSLKNKGVNVSRATVYRTLELFVNHYLIRRLDLGEGKYRYESRDSDHHDHIVCIDCKKIIEFMNNQIEELQEEVAQENGFLLQRHVHQLFGKCINETCPNK